MHIGVKFCGGCNETYNRIEALKKIKTNLPQHSFEPIRYKKKYDLVLIICGCLSACAEQSSIRLDTKRYLISQVKNVDEFIILLQK